MSVELRQWAARQAVEGSETAIEWVEGDRRTFRGKWRSCRNDGCILPAGHQGRHAE